VNARGYLDLIDRRWFDPANDSRHDEFEDLVAMLLEAAGPAADADRRTLAEVVARACLGDDHLWHDLGLPSRQHLSDLLHEHFRPLAGRNLGNMRWKKFFYLQLCERAEIRACRAPSCSVCKLQAECFGSEESPLAVISRAVPATAAA
jgi:nitrogen fixation protein NifQ